MTTEPASTGSGPGPERKTSEPTAQAPASAARRLEPLRARPGRDDSGNSGAAAAPPPISARTARLLRWLLPFVALAFGLGGYALLVATRDRPETREPVAPAPLVRVMRAASEDLRLRVVTRGTVVPRTESDLVSEVRGRVVWVSPKLFVGGVFEKGDELLRLDDREYRIARDRARATVRLRESEARLASAEAARRRELRERGAASVADLDQVENRERVARASLAEARAQREQASLDLERTVVRAPFDGRVRERSVDIGQFVSPGTKLARVFAIDFAEVRLPIQTDELAFLELDWNRLPVVERGEPGEADASVQTAPTPADPVDDGTDEQPRVRLIGRLGGREYEWQARLDRAEAAIDERTRMLHVVARVEDPYALDPARAATDALPAPAGMGAVPLPAGLFVTAEIAGRSVSDVFVLPLMALRDGDRVFVAEPAATGSGEGENAALGREAILRVRDVSVVRRDRDRVVIDRGLAEGEFVVISPLRIHSEGMRLRLVEAEQS